MANSTIQQHQPLRVPRNWNTQEKALIVQLDEVFDDIYRRFGRLRIEDMGDKFRKRFEDAEGAITEFEVDISGLRTRVSNAEGSITTLTVDVSGLTTRVINAEGDIGALDVRAGNIELAVGNKYDKVSGITINTNGIDLTGNKYIKLNSGTSIDIRTGGTFTVQSGQFSIDANGNVIFGGALNAATGTFAGTLSASCITSGTMSASRISGGTIDATNVIINNLDASKITSGTMSANKISGGTLTLGGNNNVNGTILIKDANGAQIGKWDKDGISATKGTFSGELNSPSGNIGGLLIQNNSLTANGFSILPGAQIISAGDWILSPSGLRIDNDDSNYGKVRFSLGDYYTIGRTDWPQVSITSLPPDFLFFTFQDEKISGKYSENEIRFQKVSDSDIKAKIYVNRWTSNGGTINGGGQLGESTAARWKYIYVDTINYLTMTQGSSRDIKHDIHDMPSMGARLDGLRPVTFVYDEDTEERTRYGLIYEDTVETMPEICTGSEENKAINYIELIPMLLKEIQELRVRVRDPEGRN